ncbi:MAG TPA: glutamate-cysteine ligase family protein [Candidatus Limnocylindrales bacterium]|nr:glutamate-cysteine ligase family protein [Candidatus Limnocylindrales bacterium]
MLGPENELALVDQELRVLPISDTIIKDYCGRTINFVEMPTFTFGKELQLHVMELKANSPFKSPVQFEETMQNAVSTLSQIVQEHGARLLGTGMHPLLKLKETAIWPHYHRKIYHEYAKIFNLSQHGWLNIQSFHLNLSYQKESDGIQIHNLLTNLCAYLPAITASSPIYEGKPGPDEDNRLQFYKVNQKEVPSVTADVIPEYAVSFNRFKHDVIAKYSEDLAKAGADKSLLGREWVNSRCVIFRFDRSAIEIRVMDEQECIKSDVALSCFIRAALRGLMTKKVELSAHDVLVDDFNAVIEKGLNAQVSNPHGETAKQVCQWYLDLAFEYADADEKKYLSVIKKRLEKGNLSQIILERVLRRSQKTDFKEAVVDVYSTLIKCLSDNEPYF